MEQTNKKLNSDISFIEIKYENLLFLRKKARRLSINKIEKYAKIGASLNNITLIGKSTAKDLCNKTKPDSFLQSKQKTEKEETKKRIIDKKWGYVDQSFKMLLEFRQMINLKKNEDVVNKKINDLIKIISPSVTVFKCDISINTFIDETTALDIFLCEILTYLNNALSSKEDILKKFLTSDPFMTVLDELYSNKASGLRKLIAPLFKGEITENNELIKILKIDYFQKCIIDRTFSSAGLLKILRLKEKDLCELDLNHICLPFIENQKLITYAQFITKIFESESFLQAMLITMNFQSKEIVYTKKDIGDSMTEIYEYLLYPVVFPMEEAGKLYAVTCINLKFYLSSFVVETIENNTKKVSLTLKKHSVLEKIEGLKERILYDLWTGYEFAVLILTLIHESSHILRRHLIEPKVYINTDEVEKDLLNEKINDTSGQKKKIENIPKDEKLREGGEILEYLLFGDNFTGLIIEEIQFLFDLDNWNKSLKTFREDFTNIRKLMNPSCIISRQFMNKFNGFSFRGFCGNKRN